MGNYDKRALYQSFWEDLDQLSPVQNRWLRKFTKPCVTVILEQWAQNQPSDFSLEYLLSHALVSHWELTEEGWKKAEELGLLTRLEKPPDTAGVDDDELWLTHAEAANQLFKETSSRFSIGSLKTRLTKMADKGSIKTNGQKGRERRYLKSAVDSLELRLRNECLNAAEEHYDDDDDE